MNRVPRVLFVNRMASLVRGGGETFDLEISANLEKLGVEVHYLTGAPQCARTPMPLDHANAYVVRSPYLPWFPWDRVKGGWRVRVWEFAQFENRAAAWIANNQDRYDVVQICELPRLVTLLKTTYAIRPKIVMRLTAPNAYDPTGGTRHADAVIASGTSIGIIRRGERPDVHNIPNAVDTDRFAPEPGAGRSAWRQRHGIPGDALVLLYVARLQGFKNHALLIEALARIAVEEPSVRLVLAGSGPLRSDIEKKAAAAGVAERVVFLGEVPFAVLPDIYRAGDLKVISSEYESFCFAAIEGMASGLPVVTTDCGWVPTLIGDTLAPIEQQSVRGPDPADRFASMAQGAQQRDVPGGIVTGRSDPESFARAVVRIWRDEALRRRTATWNREKAVREHGWDSSAKKLLDVYHRLVMNM